jgi:nicotinamidase-related amidase
MTTIDVAGGLLIKAEPYDWPYTRALDLEHTALVPIDWQYGFRGVTSMVITGTTTNVCVSTTMREANDPGYECLMLSDCTAATDFRNHEAALRMVLMHGGVFGAVSTSTAVLEALPALPAA